MADDLASALTEAKRIADALGFACRLPGKTPDFTFCGGPAAEAYWNYFTPARISSLLDGYDALLKLADEWRAVGCPESAGEEALMWREIECGDRLRAAITAALSGKEAGDGT